MILINVIPNLDWNYQKYLAQLKDFAMIYHFTNYVQKISQCIFKDAA